MQSTKTIGKLRSFIGFMSVIAPVSRYVEPVESLGRASQDTLQRQGPS